jgi:hypothetical protein
VSMGIKKPRLVDLLRRAQAGPATSDRDRYGRRRAVVQCHHGSHRYDVAEVRGNVVIGTTGPHDLKHASYEVLSRCNKCPGMAGLRQLDLSLIRAALRQPHHGVLKLNVDEVSRRVA